MHERPDEPTDPGPRSDDVHIWRVALDTVFPYENGLDRCLSDEERSRAALIRGTLERQRFVAARVALRDVLGRHSGIDAAALRVQRESGGRPFLEGAGALSFSLTHSLDIALIAVADRSVGIDVERLRGVAYMGRIAQRVLHPATAAALAALPEEERRLAFLDAWTQREAHVKAVGGGIFRTADDLPFTPVQPADGSVHGVSARSDGSLWSVARFRPDPDARATVVVAGAARTIRIHDWKVTHE
jgi:4'-phosphopantetheinyl transferase